jgi:hypothetical protein
MVFVNPQFLFSDAVKIMLSDDFGLYGLLQSSVFLSWVLATGAMRHEFVAFSTTNSLDTFVPPLRIEELTSVGQRHWESRLGSMRARHIGVTPVLNLFHDSDVVQKDVDNLRELHRQLDYAVTEVYGWQDLQLKHGFHQTPLGVRFTIGPTARTEVLARLLMLNHGKHRDATTVQVRRGRTLG